MTWIRNFALLSAFVPRLGKSLGVFILCVGTAEIVAATISEVSWTSHGGNYINDTIQNGNTSPLAFTSTNSLAQPLLNASDSSVNLVYGNYYAISFRSFGSHVGEGTVSFLLDGLTRYSQSVTFPDPTTASGVFASFTLPNGDMVTISSTGLSADRIRIVADGPGMAGDGTDDALYLFTYLRAADIPVPKLTIAPSSPGFSTISWTPALPGFVLNFSTNMVKEVWTNALSGVTNTIVVPNSGNNRFFRLSRP